MRVHVTPMWKLIKYYQAHITSTHFPNEINAHTPKTNEVRRSVAVITKCAHTANVVQGHIQEGQPGQAAYRIERA